MKQFLFGCVLALTLFPGCVRSPYYQKTFSIPNNQWTFDYQPRFFVSIEDTNLHYNCSMILRHTNAYTYANIWINVMVKAPGDSVFKKTRIEVPLANLQGKWLGVGMGEIYEQRRMIVLNHNEIPITDDLISISEESIDQLFHRKGTYEIRLQQNMRDPSLANILQVGIRVEKSSARSIDHPQTP